MKELSPKSLNIFKTLNLYLCFFTVGMCMAVTGPCLLDLQHIVNTDSQHIAFIYTGRFVGYLAGSILGGILLDFVPYKQTIMTVFNFLMSSTMLIMPWSGNLGTLIGLMVVNGFSIGTVDTGGNVLCLTLWGSESGPFFQALHFTFGVGSLMAPLIAAPFVGSYKDAENKTTFLNYSTIMNYEEDYNSSINSNNSSVFDFTLNFTNYSSEYINSSDFSNKSSNIVYPFSIIGAFGILVAIMFLGSTIVSPPEKKKLQIRNPKKEKDKISAGFLISVAILNVFLLFLETGTEIGFAQMLTTYVVKGRLQLSPSTGSYMTSAFWVAFTVTRLAAIFLAIKISSFTFILINLIVTLLGSLVLLFLSAYQWAMWVSTVLLGAGVATFFPAAIGWLSCYITVTNKIASIFIVGASLGGMIIPLGISSFIETFPDVLIYVVPLTTVCCSVVTLILYLILRNKEKKSVKREPESIAFITTKVST